MTIGLANGCFDILHHGHIHLFTEAKKHCQHLIIALNTDESVRRLKGLDRPVNPYHIRVEHLKAIPMVNEVIGFETEKELVDIIKNIKPHFLFKGADYHGLPITGAGVLQKHGGKVIKVPLLPGFSTTQIIKERGNG